jgi:signal transduction histidine kinase
MKSRVATAIVRVALVVAGLMAIGAFVLPALFFDRVPEGQIVVIGDPTVGDTPTVIDDLDCRRRTLETIDAPTFIVVAPRPGAATREIPWVRQAPCKPQFATGNSLLPAGAGIGLVPFVLIGLGWLVTGALIVVRQPRNTAGWIFVIFGFALVAGDFSSVAVALGAKADLAVPLLSVWALFGDGSALAVTLLPLLFLLFPDGKPPSRRWRWAEWALFAGVVCVVLGSVGTVGPLNNFVDGGILFINPVGIAALGDAAIYLTGVGTILAVLAGLSTVFAVRGRFKRSAGEERQQLRWLVMVASVAATFFVLGFMLALPLADHPLGENAPVFATLLVLFALTMAIGVPAAYLVAILRYRLWDLDVVIKKAALALVLAVLIITIGLVLVSLLAQTAIYRDASPQTSGLIGIAFGLLLIPLYRLSRRISDRLVYGSRATPYEVLTAFSGRIGETYTSDDVLTRMAQVLATGTGATRARVLVHVGDHERETASFGDGTGAEARTPVHFQGEELGALALTMPANDPMNPAKERLVQDLAAQAGPVLHNVRLLEELRASRQRLVAAQDEERRKLERNIHDGVQQQLVALAVRLKLADTMIDRDPAKAHEALATLQTDAGTTLDDLRDLARGIYPPLLADKGLVSALEAQARKAAVPTQVEADGVERYARDVESTVYFCTLEALNNIAKYAAATTATITLTQDDGHVRFRVSDDGDGFDPTVTSYGTGLQGMADRLDAIGGSLEVASVLGSGTTVTGRVPVRQN